jgi:hypothetical protein
VLVAFVVEDGAPVELMQFGGSFRAADGAPGTTRAVQGAQ